MLLLIFDANTMTMKNIALTALFLAFCLTTVAQSKKSSKKSKKKGETEVVIATPPVPLLQNALDSFSYALGLSMASFYKEQGVDSINAELVNKALSDVRSDEKPLMGEQDINNAIISYMQAAKSEKAAAEKKLSQAFLDSIKQAPGIVALPSGLMYKIITEGNGAKPGLNDKVKVHYHGKLRTGKVFDSSVDRGQPIDLTVDGVIPGWTEALQLMPEGSKWVLYMPSDLAYGDNGAGADIKPGSALVFDVELLQIIK